MKKTFLIFCLMIGLSPFVYGQNFQIGQVSLSFTDASRSNRSVPVEVYYPADAAGTGVPFTTGVQTVPVVVFGHGFVMSWDAYANIWQSLVPRGYVVAFPRTETGFSPSHLNLGQDLAFTVTALHQEAQSAASVLYQHLDTMEAVMGHSMGGGASFLSIAFNPGIDVLANLAAAETNPSAIAAAASITLPSLVIAGGNDCVTPPAAHQIPMYNALASPCKTYVSINGASHCQMADANTLCSLGEASCTPVAAISRTYQHTVIDRYLIPFLDFQLKSDCAAGASFDSLLVTDADITYQRTCLQCPSSTAVSGSLLLDAVSLYPNPVIDEVIVSFPEDREYGISILDPKGVVCLEEQFQRGTERRLQVQNLPPGIYLVQVRLPGSAPRFLRFVKP